jgi:allantoin racemase
MKLYIVHINSEAVSGPYTKHISAIFDKVKREDTTIVHRYVRSKRATDAIYSFPYLLNKLDVVQHFLTADREGFDGTMVACCGDPAVIEGRSVAAIPVVGPFEATLHLACTYGRKVGVVTVAERSWWEWTHILIDSYGLSDRVSGVGRIDIPSREAFSVGFTDPSLVAKEIEKQARILVEQGANSIVLGSAGLSCIASAAGLSQIPELGAPIFDSLTVALKTLEMRVELTRKVGLPVVSRVGHMEHLPDKDVERLRKLFELSAA